MAMTLDGSNGVTFNDSSLQGAAASPYGLKNRIINGDMRIDQRYAGTATANTINGYVLDRWYVGQVGGSTGKIIAQQNAGSVTPPAGFSNYLGITSQSAYTVGASQQYSIQQPIEGFNTADLAWGTASAKTITLSFWVRSSLTGTFAICLRNATPNRSYVSTYTISSANTWEQKSITIAGDTSGTWNATNSTGIYIDLDLGSGSSLSTTANTWTTGNYTTTSGVTNVVGTNGATWYITGVQLEVGSTATPFERRMYGQELALCQRYYWKNKGDGAGSGPYGIGHCRSNYLRGIIILPVTMRTSPSMTNTGTDADYIVDSGTSDFTSFVTRPSLDSGGPNMLNFRVQVSTGMTNGYAARLSCNSSSSFLAFDAEL
jgi:hypothetical protein